MENAINTAISVDSFIDSLIILEKLDSTHLNKLKNLLQEKDNDNQVILINDFVNSLQSENIAEDLIKTLKEIEETEQNSDNSNYVFNKINVLYELLENTDLNSENLNLNIIDKLEEYLKEKKDSDVLESELVTNLSKWGKVFNKIDSLSIDINLDRYKNLNAAKNILHTERQERIGSLVNMLKQFNTQEKEILINSLEAKNFFIGGFTKNTFEHIIDPNTTFINAYKKDLLKNYYPLEKNFKIVKLNTLVQQKESKLGYSLNEELLKLLSDNMESLDIKNNFDASLSKLINDEHQKWLNTNLHDSINNLDANSILEYLDLGGDLNYQDLDNENKTLIQTLNDKLNEEARKLIAGSYKQWNKVFDKLGDISKYTNIESTQKYTETLAVQTYLSENRGKIIKKIKSKEEFNKQIKAKKDLENEITKVSELISKLDKQIDTQTDETKKNNLKSILDTHKKSYRKKEIDIKNEFIKVASEEYKQKLTDLTRLEFKTFYENEIEGIENLDTNLNSIKSAIIDNNLVVKTGLFRGQSTLISHKESLTEDYDQYNPETETFELASNLKTGPKNLSKIASVFIKKDEHEVEEKLFFHNTEKNNTGESKLLHFNKTSEEYVEVVNEKYAKIYASFTNAILELKGVDREKWIKINEETIKPANKIVLHTKDSLDEGVVFTQNEDGNKYTLDLLNDTNEQKATSLLNNLGINNYQEIDGYFKNKVEAEKKIKERAEEEAERENRRQERLQAEAKREVEAKRKAEKQDELEILVNTIKDNNLSVSSSSTLVSHKEPNISFTPRRNVAINIREEGLKSGPSNLSKVFSVITEDGSEKQLFLWEDPKNPNNREMYIKTAGSEDFKKTIEINDIKAYASSINTLLELKEINRERWVKINEETIEPAEQIVIHLKNSLDKGVKLTRINEDEKYIAELKGATEREVNEILSDSGFRILNNKSLEKEWITKQNKKTEEENKTKRKASIKNILETLKDSTDTLTKDSKKIVIKATVETMEFLDTENEENEKELKETIKKNFENYLEYSVKNTNTETLIDELEKIKEVKFLSNEKIIINVIKTQAQIEIEKEAEIEEKVHDFFEYTNRNLAQKEAKHQKAKNIQTILEETKKLKNLESNFRKGTSKNLINKTILEQANINEDIINSDAVKNINDIKNTEIFDLLIQDNVDLTEEKTSNIIEAVRKEVEKEIREGAKEKLREKEEKEIKKESDRQNELNLMSEAEEYSSIQEKNGKQAEVEKELKIKKLVEILDEELIKTASEIKTANLPTEDTAQLSELLNNLSEEEMKELKSLPNNTNTNELNGKALIAPIVKLTSDLKRNKQEINKKKRQSTKEKANNKTRLINNIKTLENNISINEESLNKASQILFKALKNFESSSERLSHLSSIQLVKDALLNNNTFKSEIHENILSYIDNVLPITLDENELGEVTKYIIHLVKEVQDNKELDKKNIFKSFKNIQLSKLRQKFLKLNNESKEAVLNTIDESKYLNKGDSTKYLNNEEIEAIKTYLREEKETAPTSISKTLLKIPNNGNFLLEINNEVNKEALTEILTHLEKSTKDLDSEYKDAVINSTVKALGLENRHKQSIVFYLGSDIHNKTTTINDLVKQDVSFVEKIEDVIETITNEEEAQKRIKKETLKKTEREIQKQLNEKKQFEESKKRNNILEFINAFEEKAEEIKDISYKENFVEQIFTLGKFKDEKIKTSLNNLIKERTHQNLSATITNLANSNFDFFNNNGVEKIEEAGKETEKLFRKQTILENFKNKQLPKLKERFLQLDNSSKEAVAKVINNKYLSDEEIESLISYLSEKDGNLENIAKSLLKIPNNGNYLLEINKEIDEQADKLEAKREDELKAKIKAENPFAEPRKDMKISNYNSNDYDANSDYDKDNELESAVENLNNVLKGISTSLLYKATIIKDTLSPSLSAPKVENPINKIANILYKDIEKTQNQINYNLNNEHSTFKSTRKEVANSVFDNEDFLNGKLAKTTGIGINGELSETNNKHVYTIKIGEVTDKSTAQQIGLEEGYTIQIKLDSLDIDTDIDTQLTNIISKIRSCDLEIFKGLVTNKEHKYLQILDKEGKDISENISNTINEKTQKKTIEKGLFAVKDNGERVFCSSVEAYKEEMGVKQQQKRSISF